MNISITKIACLCLAFTVGSQLSAVSPTGNKHDFHVFLLAGQSNMTGEEAQTDYDTTPHPRVFVFVNNTWQPASDPLHLNRLVNGVGPGLTFGKTLARHDGNISIGLIPTAMGRTYIEDWLPGAGKGLFYSAISQIDRAKEDGVMKGVLWHQGESDANVWWRAPNYYRDLIKTVQSFREMIGIEDLPFLAGELSDELALAPGSTPYDFREDVVNGTIKAMDEIKMGGFITNEGLNVLSDKIHYTAASNKEMGRRYAQKYIDLMYVDPVQLLESLELLPAEETIAGANDTHPETIPSTDIPTGWIQTKDFGWLKLDAYPIIEHRELGPLRLSVDGLGLMTLDTFYHGLLTTTKDYFPTVYRIEDDTEYTIELNPTDRDSTEKFYNHTFLQWQESIGETPKTALELYLVAEKNIALGQQIAVDSTQALAMNDFGKVKALMKQAEGQRLFSHWIAQYLLDNHEDIQYALFFRTHLFINLLPIGDEFLITCQQNYLASLQAN